jgi:putative transposase
MIAGTIKVKRPRGGAWSGVSRAGVPSLFVRRTEAVSKLFTQPHLRGLAQGDFELSLRGLLGDGAPLSASSIERLRGKWQLNYEAWGSRRLDNLCTPGPMVSM